MVTQKSYRSIVALALLAGLSPVLAAERGLPSAAHATNAALLELWKYDAVRWAWERANQDASFSSDIKLTSADTNIDHYLSALRTNEIAGGRSNGFAPPHPFFEMRNAIQKRSRVYSLLRQMPKGGVLHVHSTSAGRAEWVAQTAIASNCWVYWNGNTNDPTNGTLSWTQADSNYVQVAQARRGKPNFERHLVSLLTIDARDEIHPAWAAWSACYSRMVGLLTRPSFFNAYMVDAFETFARDNADYVELRTDIPYFVGTNVPQGITNCIRQYQIAEQQVRQKYPDFKLAVIISPYRGSGLSDISNRIDAALALRSDPQLGNFVVGFDLVGEEMPSTALVRMVPALWGYLQQRTNECGITLPYMFHGGESDWGDDDNLIDAVLLKSHRIGHGINLYRYPVLQQTVRDQPCPIELCPISNQLLRYTLDMRAHPGAGY